MDRNGYEKAIRAALRKPSRTLEVCFRGTDTSLRFSVNIDGETVAGTAFAVCDPADEYNQRIGYELALDRAIRNAAEWHADMDAMRRRERAERKRQWDAAHEKPPAPERKKTVRVEGNYLFCDDALAAAIAEIPGVDRVSGREPDAACRYIHFDPRYDRAEVVAAIEAVE